MPDDANDLFSQRTNAQRFDSIVRTMTAAFLALVLVIASCVVAILNQGDALGATGASLFALTGTAVGFYFGGHVAQNTAAMEEARQFKATSDSEASAVRSEASAVRSEADR